MKEGGRARRIEAQIQRALAELVPRLVKDPRVGSVTFTAVTLTPDMSEARVYFLPFGGKHPASEVLRGLDSASGLLRGAIGRQLQLRHAPRLHFTVDVQQEKAEALTRLISAAVKHDAETHVAGQDPPGAPAGAPGDSKP